MKWRDRVPADVLVAAVLLATASLSVLFLGSLVAPPKTLFGRSMTAIAPSMFPSIVLSMLVVLCALFLALRIREAIAEPLASQGAEGWREGISFFTLLTFYALAMAPLGFLISTSLTLAAISWLVGNRSMIQIVILSLASPIALYLIATRFLAVSLPEQDFIERLFARLLG